MRFKSSVFTTLILMLLLTSSIPVAAAESVSVLEQSMSETLDLWREGSYEQLFERLAHRGKTSREAFVKKMRDTSIRPACCWQKMEHFKVLNEKRTEATVYAKVGLEGTAIPSNSSTREFKLTHQEGIWKMQLADVLSIAGVTGKKTKHNSRKSQNSIVIVN